MVLLYGAKLLKQTWTNYSVILQKRSLLLIHFAPYRSHAIPLYIHYNVVPLNFQYCSQFVLLCMLAYILASRAGQRALEHKVIQQEEIKKRKKRKGNKKKKER